MSDTPTGPGSWQASDGRWYPASDHPDPAYRQQYGGASNAFAGGMGGLADAVDYSGATAGYPARYDLPGGARKIANWRAFVHLFMAIPHLVIVSVLQYVSQILAVVSWFIILFTGKLPAGLANFQAMYVRYSNRTTSFAVLLHDQYPPFDFDTTSADNGRAADRTDFTPELTGRNRLTVAFRIILAIPAVIVFSVVVLAAYLAYIVGWFAVLFTGQMPEGIARFLIGTGRWGTRVQAYLLLLTDQYPPFSLD